MKKIGDIKEHDENEEASEMGEDREALTTENRKIWNQGYLRKNGY